MSKEKPIEVQAFVYKNEEQDLQVEAKNFLNSFSRDKDIADFSVIPQHIKLSILQNIPQSFIKYRPLSGSTTVPYLPHEHAEKFLNFVFNWEVSMDVLDHGIDAFDKYYEAWALVKFTFGSGENMITRTVMSTHKGFKNPAITKMDSVKSAISKSYTVVARTFGIASNLAEKEKQAYKREQKQREQQDQQKPQEAGKSFEPSIPNPQY